MGRPPPGGQPLCDGVGRVLPRPAADRLERADPARPVPLPRGPGGGRAGEHPPHAGDRRGAGPAGPRGTGRGAEPPGSARRPACRQRAAAGRGARRMSGTRVRSTAEQIRDVARAIRRRNVEMVRAAGNGHIGGDLSAADILATLYWGVLKVDPDRPGDPERDRYIQSKGHASGVLYATLAARGFIPDELLDTYMAEGSPLNGHPDRKKVPGGETNTGPLGHGLPVAVGTAIAARLDGSPRRTFVLCGDGELQEGSNWEAAMAAGHQKLDNLVAIVDRNGLQQGARTEETNTLDPLDARFAAFGWAVRDIDGHDVDALLEAFAAVPFAPGKPSCIIARTVKGRGVSFIEDRVEWHHKVPTAEQAESALTELGGGASASTAARPSSGR